MDVSEDGTVTGSVDVSKLDEIDPKTDEAKAQLEALKANAAVTEEQDKEAEKAAKEAEKADEKEAKEAEKAAAESSKEQQKAAPKPQSHTGKE